MANPRQELEAHITGARAAAARRNVGVIREIGDGVATIEGLTDAMVNEVIDLGAGVTGLALNLEETEVGAIASDVTYPVGKTAPGIIRRPPMSQPGQTGIAVDAVIPTGRGRRELIIGNRATGQTTSCIDTIISQARLSRAAEEAGHTDSRPLYCIYVAIGQKQSIIARVMAVLERAGAMPYTIVVASSASDPAANQYLAPFTGAAMGEWFRDNGMEALIVYDDLSRHAVACRQVSLVLKRPSGRDPYPGDVFAVHSRLLERAARVGARCGNGSPSAPPIIGGRPVGLARSVGGATHTEGRPRPLPRAGGIRAIRLAPRAPRRRCAPS